MGAGRVCSIHQEWCPDGACRWCEPAPADGLSVEIPLGDYTFDIPAGQSFGLGDVSAALKEAWTLARREDPLPTRVTGMLRTDAPSFGGHFVLAHDWSSTGFCMRCGNSRHAEQRECRP